MDRDQKLPKQKKGPKESSRIRRSTKRTKIVQTLMDRAVAYATAGDLRGAVKVYRKLLQADPENPRWPHKLGEAYMRLDQKEEALLAFKKAASLYSQQGFANKAQAVLDLIQE